MKIEIDTFIKNNAKVMLHIVMIMILTSCLFIHYHTPASEKRGYTVLALSVLPSVLLFVTNIFRHTFLSNHALITATSNNQLKVFWIRCQLLTSQYLLFNSPTGAFENIVGKEENSCNHHFIFFLQYFLPFQRKIKSII